MGITNENNFEGFAEKYKYYDSEKKNLNIPLLREDVIKLVNKAQENVNMNLLFWTDIKADIKTQKL